MAVQLLRFQSIIRNGGAVPHPNCVGSPLWTDAVVLVANTAQTYTPPTGAVILRLTASAGPLYINFNAVAAVPAANVTGGGASTMVLAQLSSVLLPIPNTALPLSMICAAAATVTIEAWN